MKRILKISAVFIAYLLLCGRSCDNEEGMRNWQEQQLSIVKDSLREKFETDYLSEESRFAVEISAIQKLNDFADYFKILSDSNTDSAFRTQAALMARNLFISSEASLACGNIFDSTIDYVMVDRFIEKALADEARSAEITYDSILISEALQKVRDSAYAGKLSALQRVSIYTSDGLIRSQVRPIIVDIEALRKQKVFGKDTVIVWVVFLGDMRYE
jgi:hypothetical protein